MEHESRSMSGSTCSQTRELTRANSNIYECRPSLKNLEKLDLMPEREQRELRGVKGGRTAEGDDV